MTFHNWHHTSVEAPKLTFSWFLPYFLNTSECFIYSWDILFHCNSFGNQVEKRPLPWKPFFRVENGIFPHGKRLSLEKGLFPHGKRLSLEKGLFPLEIQVNCNGQCPAAKKVLLQRLPETFWSYSVQIWVKLAVLSLVLALDQSRY